MSSQRKWWSGHELYGMRPQEYSFREAFYQEFPYIDLNPEDDETAQLSYWKSLYPEKMKKIQMQVEEACEALEYDGSPMYDEYPDKVYLRKMCNEIYNRMMEEEEFAQQEELPPDLFDTALTDEADQARSNQRRPPRPYGSRPPMPPGPRPPRPPRNPWLRDAIEVLLYQEMHRRRCARGRCRRRWY